MSYVTSAVIVVDYAPREVEEMLTAPQAFGRESGREQSFRKLDDHAAGGGKSLENDVYAAGLNHIDSEELEHWFMGLPWGSVGSAVLAYSVEDDYRTVLTTPGWEEKGEG